MSMSVHVEHETFAKPPALPPRQKKQTLLRTLLKNMNEPVIAQGKAALQQQMRDYQVNGQAGGDFMAAPGSPGSSHDRQRQIERALRQELEEKKQVQAQLQSENKMLKQMVNVRNPNMRQMDPASLTPDGLPAAPSSDGIIDGVKDGYINRLTRELTVLKAKFQDQEKRFLTVQRERDGAFHQLAEQDRKAQSLQQRVEELKGALAVAQNQVQKQQHQLHLMEAAGGRDLVAKLKAEVNTLRESLQRLNRENQVLKEMNTSPGNSRQPNSNSLGASNSVAHCSQELEYLHKVVDMLRATVLEQQEKLLSLRAPQSSQKASLMSHLTKMQSCPVTTRSAPVGAGTVGSDGLVGKRTRSAEDTLARSLRTTTMATSGSGVGRSAQATLLDTAVRDPSTPLSPRAVQNDERKRGDNWLEPEDLMLEPRSASPKSVGSLMEDKDVSQEKKEVEGVVNPFYSSGAQLFRDNQSQPGTDPATGAMAAGANSDAEATAARSPDAMMACSPQVLSPAEFLEAASRPLGRSDMGESASFCDAGIEMNSPPTSLTMAGLNSPATAQDMMNVLSRRRPPPPTPLNPLDDLLTSSQAEGVTPAVLRRRTTEPSGPPPLSSSSTSGLPQFTFEAEVEPKGAIGACVGPGDDNQHLMAKYLQSGSVIPPTSSSSPSPALQPTQNLVPSGLSGYQTATASAGPAGSLTDRNYVRVVNQNMMVGGNMIYNPSAAGLQAQQPLRQVPISDNSVPASAQFPGGGTFTAQDLNPIPNSHYQPHQPNQQQRIPTSTVLFPPATVAHGLQRKPSVHTDSSQYLPERNVGFAPTLQPPPPPPVSQADVTGPRVNSDRSCPVCGQDFRHLPMEDFQAHVFECFDEAGPETIKAPAAVEGLPPNALGRGAGLADRTCPICEMRFDPCVPQLDFEKHVHNHFGEENFEILQP